LKDERWEMRGREHGEEGRFERWEADLRDRDERQIWERGRFERWRDERQGEVAAEKVRMVR
jgi:hypothetical protein